MSTEVVGLLRATNEGLSLMLVGPEDVINFKKIYKTLKKDEDIPLFPVQTKYMDAVKVKGKAGSPALMRGGACAAPGFALGFLEYCFWNEFLVLWKRNGGRHSSKGRSKG